MKMVGQNIQRMKKMKPLDDMSSDAINREIAELREDVLLWSGVLAVPEGWILDWGKYQVFPDYLEWQHAGKLLEEMWNDCMTPLLQVIVGIINAYNAMQVHERIGDRLTDAIRRGWLMWMRGDDANKD